MADHSIRPWRVDARDFPHTASAEERAAFLVRYAILAPSSHNTQPWRFDVGPGRIDLYADFSRWLRRADADQRELFLSLGCALENLLIAADRFGLEPDVQYRPNEENAALAATIWLTEGKQRRDERAPPRSAGLFHALSSRATNREAYDARPVPEAMRASLQSIAREPGVHVHLTDDPHIRRGFDELTVRADEIQFADPAWRRELARWLGRGVFGHGRWQARASGVAVAHLDLARPVAKRDRELLHSAALLGVVGVDRVSRASRLRAGQAFERLFLAATWAGLALQPMNQVLQVDETRDEFERLLPVGWGTPQMTFRLGFGERREHTPRRPVRSVLRRARAPAGGEGAADEARSRPAGRTGR
jgi:hypothetical protein